MRCASVQILECIDRGVQRGGVGGVEQADDDERRDATGRRPTRGRECGHPTERHEHGDEDARAEGVAPGGGLANGRMRREAQAANPGAERDERRCAAATDTGREVAKHGKDACDQHGEVGERGPSHREEDGGQDVRAQQRQRHDAGGGE